MEEIVNVLCNEVFGLTVEEFEQLSSEEEAKLFTVNLTAPNGEVEEIYYEGEYIYKYPISQSGNYTFKATNSKGRTSEITVEIDETKIKTCTIDVYDFDDNNGYKKIETKTITFIDGQTWREITDDLYNKVFSHRDLFIGEGDDIKEVLSTDKIIENGVYSSKPRFE